MSDIDGILHGSIDMHVHHGPDSLLNRRLDALGTAKQAREFGIRGIILKSHDYPTAALAHLVNQLVPEVYTFGSLCLDYESGGLNTFSVEASAKLGARVVWMPTFSAANSRQVAADALGINLPGRGTNILQEGKLTPAVTDILHIIKDYDMILATGHLSPKEIFTLVEEAKQIGISKIIITHALEQSVVEESLNMEAQQRLASKGAFIEHCFLTLMPTGGKIDPSQMVAAIRAVGAEHCIMSSDFGQIYHPSPPEGMRMFIGTMLRYGLAKDDIELMVKKNPAHLLNLD